MDPFFFSKRAPLYVALALAALCTGVWSVVYAETPRHPGVLVVAVLDVGQGDAIYIESPTGVQLLLDSGPDDSVLRVLPDVMPRLDRSLDAIVATHPDADHIGGFKKLLERYDVGAYIYPNIPKDTAVARALEEQVDAQDIPRVVARRGMTLELGDGAVLTVLYPERDVSHLGGDKANEGGVVARLVYGEFEALFTADVGGGVEARLLQLDAEGLDSDFLKVGHHGSKYSSTPTFVAAVSPEVAAISVGKNSYGHPTAQALAELGRVGAEILRTDEKGTIRCVSDGASFSCK